MPGLLICLHIWLNIFFFKYYSYYGKSNNSGKKCYIINSSKSAINCWILRYTRHPVYCTYELLIMKLKFRNLEGQYPPLFNWERNKRQWTSHQTHIHNSVLRKKTRGRRPPSKLSLCYHSRILKSYEKTRKDTMAISTQKRGFRGNFVRVIKQKHNIN